MRSRVAALIGSVAAIALAAPAGAITHGDLDGNGHPNVGAVLVSLNADNAPAPELVGYTIQFCTGSVLSHAVVLTAGHCTDGFRLFGIRPQDVHVTFDSDTKLSTPANRPDHWVGITSSATHPNFRYGGQDTAYNDVGVLRLAEDVDLDPVHLPPVGWLSAQAAHGGLVGAEFTTVGYGITGRDRSPFSPRVNDTFDDFRRVAMQPFTSLTPYQLGLSNNATQTGGGGTCNGDSGGPAFPAWSGAPNYQVAVTTSGDPVCRSQSRRQRLDTRIVHDWLMDQID
jgi:secreted trypsin-like serine protease